MSSIMHLPPAPSVTTAVEQLQGAVDAVVSLVVAGRLELLPESELLGVTVRLQGIASQANAVIVSAVAQVRAGEVARAEGFASTSRWLEVDAGLSHGRSRAAVALGEKLQWEFDATREAWLAGEISEGAVQVITSLIPRKLKGLGEAAYVAERTELEAMALHHARTSTVAEVRRAIERAAIVADRVAAAAAVVAAKESEFLSFTPVQDGVEVRGFFSTETAAVVLTAFDQCHDAKYRNGVLVEDPADDLDQQEVRAPGLRRRRRQHRNAEILTELVTHLLDDGVLGTKHAQRPHVTVTVHADDYAAGLGGDVLLPGFGAVPVPNSTIDRVLCDAELHPVLTRRPGGPHGDGGSVQGQYPGSVAGSTDPPWRPALRARDGGRGGWELDVPGERQPTSAEIAADTDVASVTRFGAELHDRVSSWNRFLGEPGRHVLDVGRSFRTAPPKIRRALAVRDGGCSAPGCDTDPSRCEAHHITHWEHLGETSISNMVLLCAPHHRMVHEGRWRLERRADLDPGHPAFVALTRPTTLPTS